MDELFNTLHYMNTTVVLSIAAGVAAIFILLIAYDVVVRRRNSKKNQRGGTGKSPGFFKRMRMMQDSLKLEIKRHKRHAQRSREREITLRAAAHTSRREPKPPRT